MSDDAVPVELPRYAIRYLAEMCKHERVRLSKAIRNRPTWGIGAEASYDSLNQIECALPAWADKAWADKDEQP